MRKTILYISIFISLIQFINILKIILVDWERLTQYGFGYLSGKIVILTILLFIIYLTSKKKTIKPS